MSYGRLLLAFALLSGCRPDTLVTTPHDLGPPKTDAAPDPSVAPDLAGADLAGVDLTGAPAPDLAPPGPVVTTIRVHYPDSGHTMALRGDTAPLDWVKGVALTAAPDKTTFTYTFPMLAAPVQYKPLLDDTTWAHGENYTVQPGQSVDIYPHFVATKGSYKQLFASFSSKILDFNQPVMVYLPASYDENTLARYPVLYMQDGQNLFDPATAFLQNEWQVDETLDAAGDSQPAPKSIAEIIVIGPYSGPDRNNIYTPIRDNSEGFGGKGDLYLRMLSEELKPQVDAMLRTRPEPEHTGILGSSLGGLISAWAGCKYAGTFGLVGIMSPSTWWNSNWIIGQVMQMSPTPRPTRVYLDSGDSGPSNDDVTQTAMLADAFRGIGFSDGTSLDYQVQMGAQHSETWWKLRFPDAAQFLFGKR